MVYVPEGGYFLSMILRWQKGNTGYPLVDAGMRELWQTGWMQQNVRMTTAVFLVEFMNMHWKEGEKWYTDTLVSRATHILV